MSQKSVDFFFDVGSPASYQLSITSPQYPNSHFTVWTLVLKFMTSRNRSLTFIDTPFGNP